MYRGKFEHFGSGEVIGWVAKEGDQRPVTVALYVDGRFVVEQVADYYRKDLEEFGLGDGRHAFYIRIPQRYFDDAAHTYEVRLKDDNKTSLGTNIAAFRPGTPYQDRSNARKSQFQRRVHR